MIHHASLPVASLERSCSLYDAVLGVLGYRRLSSSSGFAGYGIEAGRDRFALMEADSARSAGPGSHLALAAPSRDAVDAFHQAAMQNGATDNGRPALRPHYGPGYYATFIIDPDGHRIEAVHKQ